mmetsp:Transcript_15056/g.26199  ORF Transcript_15056/g.26199 Transcript_15056/m.26199 type:complete len:303 (+) Transcript_15056:117-1025(+)
MANYGGGFNNFGGVGGFMAENDGGGRPGSRPGSVGGAGAEKHKAMLPVTIKQILQADNTAGDDVFLMNGVVPMQDVTFVAFIASLQALSTNTDYVLNDFTGTIRATKWNDAEGEPNADGHQEGTWVRFMATINSSVEQGRTLKIMQSFPVQDFNEITYHRLEVLRTYLEYTRGKLNKNSAGGGIGMMMPTDGTNPLMAGAAGKMNDGFGNVGGNNPYNANTDRTGANAMQYGSGLLSNVQHEVLGFISQKHPTSPDGVHQDEILSAFRGRYSDRDVTTALQFLQDEGHIYSSISEFHFVPCV